MLKKAIRFFLLLCPTAALAFVLLLSASRVAAQSVHGSGTTNFVPLWTSSTTIGNSALSQSGADLTTSGNIIAFGIRAKAFVGGGSGLTGVNAAQLGGIAPGGFAQLGAASNVFSGTVSATTINSSNPYQLGGAPVLSIAGSGNLYVGQGAGASNTTGFHNTAAGLDALFSNTTGDSNTAAGVEALYSNTTGAANTAAGLGALFLNTTGAFNSAAGFEALLHNTEGNSNTAAGFEALLNTTTGSGNTAIGNSAGAGLTGGDSNNIDINNGGFAGDSGIIRIGTAGTQTSTYVAGITGVMTGSPATSPVLVDGNGQLGTIASSRRYKEDIHSMGAASDGLLRLRPVTFRYKKPYADGSQPIEYGLIAEEVAEVYPELVVRGKDGQAETVQYYKLDAMLLNEVQKLAKQHAADHAEIAVLKGQIAEQTKETKEQQLAMEQLQAQVRVMQAALSASQNGSERTVAAKR